jgi:excisionase family DNA binding protein
MNSTEVELLTVKEAAVLLRTSHDTVLRMIIDGTLRARPNRPGTSRRHWRIDRAEIVALVAPDAIDANNQNNS